MVRKASGDFSSPASASASTSRESSCSTSMPSASSFKAVLILNSPGAQRRFDPLTQQGRGFERHHPSCRDRSLFTGLGITTDAGFLPAHHKISEPRELHILIALEFGANHLQHPF